MSEVYEDAECGLGLAQCVGKSCAQIVWSSGGAGYSPSSFKYSPLLFSWRLHLRLCLVASLLSCLIDRLGM